MLTGGVVFRIAPSFEHTITMRQKQLYLPETNILVTRFLTRNSIAEIIDFMPIKTARCLTHQHHIIRAVHLVSGSLPLEMVCRPDFNYARDEHTVTLSSDGALFHSETLCLGLASTVPLAEDGRGGVHAHFTLHTGQWAYFILESARYNDMTPQCLAHHQYEIAFRETMDYWQRWLSRCKYQGRWREMVQRLALALKLLTYAPTGAIVAAATTSLPETYRGDHATGIIATLRERRRLYHL